MWQATDHAGRATSTEQAARCAATAVTADLGRKTTDANPRGAPMRSRRKPVTISDMSQSRSILRAQPGDRLVIRAHHTGEAEHDGEILVEHERSRRESTRG
jgi:Domain of unknown function (DUF1918)